MSWHLRGSYFEACNCEAICPCRRIDGTPGGRSTHGVCMGVLSWLIADGAAGDVDLAGLPVALAIRYSDDEPGSPWSWILYLDAHATGEQRAALEAIFSGELGGDAATHFPWAWKASRPLGVRAVPIEVVHEPRRGFFRAGEYVTVRVGPPVADPDPVTCVISGHDRTGAEHHGELLRVADGALAYELSGRCAYQSTFDYAA